MRKLVYSLLLAFCVSAFAACDSKTRTSENNTETQANTDAAEGNPEAGVGATGTDNTTGETGTDADHHPADTSHEGHGH